MFHGFAFILAIIPARAFVGEATKLPPQYFDVTVGIATVFFYPAAWLLIFAMLALITVFIFMTVSYLLQITTLPMINEAFILTGNIFPENSQPRQFLLTGRKEWMSQMTNHACGALMICLIAISASVMSTSAAIPFLPALKWIAYAADFQPPGMYPGVDASKRLRLLDNGVVAYAERKGWLIEITKDYVVSPKGS